MSIKTSKMATTSSFNRVPMQRIAVGWSHVPRLISHARDIDSNRIVRIRSGRRPVPLRSHIGLSQVVRVFAADSKLKKMARRIASPSINWSALAERVPEAEKSLFIAFKTKSDQYLRRMEASPESLPKLDWAHYKKNIALSGMVDKFQKEYDSLKISYPEDKFTSAVDAQEKEVVAAVKEFVTQSNERIKDFESKVTHIKGLLPFEEMTMEDFRDAYPDIALDPLERPTFWPHHPDEQLAPEDVKK